MNKPKAFLLLSLVLGSAGAQTSIQPSAQPALTAPASSTTTIGADTRLAAANVSINVGTYGGPLSSLLSAVASSAGYQVIFDTNVDALAPASTLATDAAPSASSAPGVSAAPGSRPVVYSFSNTPFNQVWPLLMDTYGLSYDVLNVGNSKVLRVGTNPIQRVVKLTNADAGEVANQVKLFFGTPVYSETPLKDAQGNVISVSRSVTDVKLDSPTLRIVADPRTNSLIVRGTNKEVNEVARLAAQLDTSASAGAASTGASALTGQQTVQRVYSVKGLQGDITALLGAQYPNIKVTPVGQTGQLVITGQQNQLDAALALLGKVDQPSQAVSAAEIQQRVFQLVNASAEQVKAVLDNTLSRQVSMQTTSASQLQRNADVSAAALSGLTPTQARQAQAAQAASAAAASVVPSSADAGAAADAATIIADKRTNTLIVRGTAQQVSQIAELVPTLDKRVPQVNVQVRIQEITDTAMRALGVNWKAGFGGFNIGIAPNSDGNSGLTASFDPTRALVGGFNILPTLTAMESQGQTRRVYDGSISMQSGQRNTGTGGVTQDASAGAAAVIKSGGTLELNIVGSGGSESIQKSYPYGVTLGFYDPQVAPDGTVTVRVRGTVTAQPGNIANQALINLTSSEAQSTISFKNGETVLLSGLLGTDSSSNKSGVPFLSSIPVVGGAFGQQNKNNRQVQLMVVITGTVLE